MSEVWGIEEKDFFKLVELMNEFNKDNKVFATQVFLKEAEDKYGNIDMYWYALIYYEPNHRQEFKLNTKKSAGLTSFPSSALATTPQINKLKKLGYKGDMNLTKREAWELTQRLIKRFQTQNFTKKICKKKLK